MTTEEEKVRALCREWAQDHSHAQAVCMKYFPREKVEGDSYGVPGIQDLIDMLDSKLQELCPKTPSAP